jgi:hypothetical protein
MSMSHSRRAICVAGVLGLAACSDGLPPSPRPAEITAPTTSVLVGGTVAFVGSADGDAVWSVNGVAGGNSRFGTITTDGVYTAPDLVPTGNPVSIRIASSAAPEDSASTKLAIVPSTMTGEWVAWQPRIVNAARTDSVALLVHVAPTITDVLLAPTGNGTPVTFRHITGQLYQLDLSAAMVLSGYVTGDFHKFVGFIDYMAGTTRALRGNSFVNVRDVTMADAPVTMLATDAGASARVLNVRVDDVPSSGVAHSVATQRLYQLFADDFDFVAVVQPVNPYENRYYIGVRNTTAGVGLGTQNSGALYGSTSRLQGIIHYPIDGFFDLGEKAAVHEIGHRWMNFLSNTALAPGISHWPISSLASGVMGFSIPSSGAGGTFNSSFLANGDGTYRLVPAADTGGYNDLELYLMGLLPKDSVGPHIVFQNQAQFPLASGASAAGPVTTLTVDDIIAVHGARNPAYGAAQTNFRLATLVLSSGRLLSADEMAFFEHMAARGEATLRLRYTSGFANGSSKPFYVATGGRARLTTTLK